MTEEQIKHMAERFLAWRLPDDFNPDGGINFQPEYNVHTNRTSPPLTMRHEPTGTCLFTYTQAVEMVRHMAEGLPS